eukprot:CAMPEP_0167772414 /NCGR_PEP_ID=MMETSP0111_2-20121227/834_1 /TAXON_ID=91324 /ORGANISM="Lotharella globosa, Strain CCCM811" /LENGTH=151 /DNA_ID=CAMNT_0007661903 /DNA_START=96 /DNA_END=551 /DNA_ORIENTATION=-
MTGTWKWTKTQGDTVQFLADQGYSWLTRKLVGGLMKSAYEKTEVITMDEKSYKCEEKGAPRNPQHTQTIDLTIGSGEAKEFVYGANKKASVSVKWSERKDRLIFTTSNEDYPKIFFRYVNADGLLVEEMHVLDKKSGKPMTGSLIQFFKKQ